MLFTLEALPARYGDALLLHYGDAGSPGLIVIDGGTAGVYDAALRPRLQQLRAAHRKRLENAGAALNSEETAPLPVRMAMVSHIDDDHIRGLLDWFGALVALKEDEQALPDDVLTLWHNSFDDVVGSEAPQLEASLQDAVTAASVGFSVQPHLDEWQPGALIVASVQQGRELRNLAAALGIPLNRPLPGLVLAPPAGAEPVALQRGVPAGLTFTVLGPRDKQVKALQRKWDQALPKILSRERAEREQLAAAFSDTSVFNLSSIVVLAEAAGKKMLLTGDARGDFILEGLRVAGLLGADGTYHVDLLKLPHHGSCRNLTEDFFRQVTADHYVVSSDGDKFKNPDLETLEWLRNARGDTPFRLHLTYPPIHRQRDDEDGFAPVFAFDEMMALFNRDRDDGKPYQVRFREPGAPSVTVDLGTEPLAF